MSDPRDVLWTPSTARAEASTMADFERFLVQKHDLNFVDYADMWRWSISELEVFWGAISDYFGMRFFSLAKRF